MKPKNRVFCPECGRSKMLFETAKKAYNFIRYNAEEIEEENGVAPIRAYYCKCCCGWHLTSTKKHINYRNKNKVSVQAGK